MRLRAVTIFLPANEFAQKIHSLAKGWFRRGPLCVSLREVLTLHT